MSKDERTDFDEWLASMFEEHGEFTVLVILTEVGQRSILPLCSTYLHVIGSEVAWGEVTLMFEGSGQKWDGAAFFPTKAAQGGPIDDATAKRRLAELQAKVIQDRMTLNEGHFFDILGRRIKVEPIGDA